MDRDEQRRLPYMAPLDGIRAIAILAVLLFHVWPVALKGGFTGVDVFFVLSGFLITSIILHDLGGGRFSIREFYLRRVQRLLPNAVVTILAVLFLWTFLMPPGAAIQPAQHGLWALFNLSNIYNWIHLGGYWGNEAEWAPLTHFWSLGVEEQFYLLFPGVLVLLSRLWPTRLRTGLTATAMVSFGISLYGTYAHPVATFYLLPTRVWELLLGAILAASRFSPGWPKMPQGFLGRFLGTRSGEAMGWVGLIAIVAGFFVINEHDRFPGLISLGPTVGTALLLMSVAQGETRLSRFLSTPWMVRTGKLSYSLYLWHWPLITLGKLHAGFSGKPQLAGAAVGGVAGILLGVAAYLSVERPLRERGPGRPRRLAIIAAGFSVAVLACGIVMMRRPVMDPEHRFDPPSSYGRLFDAGRSATAELSLGVSVADVDYPPAPPRSHDAWRTGGIVHLHGAGGPRVVVLGSSHALMYSRLIDDICREMGISVAFLGMGEGTPAFFETTVNPNFSSPLEAREFDDARRRWIREWRPDAVFVIDRWDSRVSEFPDFEERLRSFLKELSPLVGRVLFVTQVPVVKQGEGVNLRGFTTWRMGDSTVLPRLDPDSNERLRKQVITLVEAAQADFPNLRVLRADLPFYQDDGSIRYAAGRRFFYTDDDHLTDIGTEQLRSLFEKAIAEARAGSSSR